MDEVLTLTLTLTSWTRYASPIPHANPLTPPLPLPLPLPPSRPGFDHRVDAQRGEARLGG